MRECFDSVLVDILPVDDYVMLNLCNSNEFIRYFLGSPKLKIDPKRCTEALELFVETYGPFARAVYDIGYKL